MACENWKEYNASIRLRGREVRDALDKSEQTEGCYFLQLNLQGRSVWVGFKDPFETGIDRLHALYYKAQNRKGDYVFLCLGLWRDSPHADILFETLNRVQTRTDPILSGKDVNDFMVGQSECIVLHQPTYVSEQSKNICYYQ